MRNASDSAILKGNGHTMGSHAAFEPLETAVDLAQRSDLGWRDSYLQSAAVSASGDAWGLAILDAFVLESGAVSPIYVRSVGATHLVSSESLATSQQQTIALLDEWLADDSGYDERTWPVLREALNRDRLSSRKLF